MKFEEIQVGDRIRLVFNDGDHIEEVTNVHEGVVTTNRSYIYRDYVGTYYTVELIERPRKLPTEPGYYVSRGDLELPPESWGLYLYTGSGWSLDVDDWGVIPDEDVPEDLVKLEVKA